MARKEPHWVKLFLRELSRTGNARLSAERAGVDHTSAYQRRKRHGGFAEAWEGALEAFKGRGPPSPSAADAAPPSPPRGEDVIRPDGKLIRGSAARWSKRAEGRFLAELAASANVRRAARAAGFSTTAIHKRRLKDAQFSEAWDAAIAAGKAGLEAMLVEVAQRRFDPDALPLSDKDPQVSIGEAISIVKLQRAEPGRGPANGGGRAPHVATPEEAERDLIRRLKIFAKRVEAEDRAKGWSPHEFPVPPGSGGGEAKQVWLPPGFRIVGPDPSSSSGQG